MTDKQVNLRQGLQRLGFTTGVQMRLYGEVFDFVGEPIFLTDYLVVIKAQEKKTGEIRRVGIPLPVVYMASGSHVAA